MEEFIDNIPYGFYANNEKECIEILKTLIFSKKTNNKINYNNEIESDIYSHYYQTKTLSKILNINNNNNNLKWNTGSKKLRYVICVGVKITELLEED